MTSTYNTLAQQSQTLERLKEEKQHLLSRIKALTSARNRTFRRICNVATKAADVKKTGIRALVYKRSPNLIHICVQNMKPRLHQQGWSCEEKAVIDNVKQALMAEGFDFEERGCEVYDDGTLIEWSFLQ